MAIDLRIIGGILFGVIAGVAGYLYGKGKCNKRHDDGGRGQFRRHPQYMFNKGGPE